MTDRELKRLLRLLKCLAMEEFEWWIRGPYSDELINPRDYQNRVKPKLALVRASGLPMVSKGPSQ